MSTRGMFAIRNKRGYQKAAYIISDAYYSSAGKKIATAYFKGRIKKMRMWAEGKKTPDGPYVHPEPISIKPDPDDLNVKDWMKASSNNQYSYVYDEDRDVVKVYRNTEPIFVMDRKKDSMKDVLRAMKAYDDNWNEEDGDGYPERRHVSVYRAPSKKAIRIAVGVGVGLVLLYTAATAYNVYRNTGR